MITEKKLFDLRTQNGSLKRRKTALLAHSELDSLVSNVFTYLLVIRSIGDKKASGERLFKTKLIKKVVDSLETFQSEYFEFGGTFDWESWKQEGRQLRHEQLKCIVTQQLSIIETATIIWCEEYKKCSEKKMQMLYAAEIMMKDVEKAVDFLPKAWCYDINNNTQKLSA